MGPARRRGKEGERRAAKRLGGERTGYIPGEPDVTTSRFAVECKERTGLPQWLTHAMEQAKSTSKAGRLGLVVIHQKAKRESIVIMTLTDFEALVKEDGPVCGLQGK